MNNDPQCVTSYQIIPRLHGGLQENFELILSQDSVTLAFSTDNVNMFRSQIII